MSFFGGSTSGITTDSTHQQHGDSSNNGQRLPAPVTTDSSDPSSFRAQARNLDAKVVSVVALKQVDPNSTSLGREPDLPLFAHQSNALGSKDPRLLQISAVLLDGRFSPRR